MSRNYRIRAVCYATDGQVTAGNPTRKMIKCQNELVALLGELPGVEVAAYTMGDLMKTMYWTAHEELATGPTCGHKSWKAYIVMRELMNVDEGDVVWYMDADMRWLPGVDVLARFVDLAKEQSIVLRKFGYTNKKFTRRDTFINMGMDAPKYWDAPHLRAGVLAFERNNRTLRFVHDWLVASLSYNVIAEKESVRGEELETFWVHRREQSILSILAVHYDVEPYRINDVFVQKICSGEPTGYDG